MQGSAEDYTEVMTKFFEARQSDMPHLNRILDFNSLDKVSDTTSFYRIATAIIKHANLTNKPSTELCLYFIFSRKGNRIDLL